MRSSIKLALPLALCLSSVAISAEASPSYDGTWSVQLITQQGKCDPSYSWSVAVNDGRIENAGFFVQTAGSIDRRGRVTLHVTHGADVVAAFGRALGQTAQGAWRSATLQCSGAWRAERS